MPVNRTTVNRQDSSLRRLRSTPGRQDGLFWNSETRGTAQPAGRLVAEAAAEGYDPNKPASAPFWGYQYRIITAQGPAGSGGFALLAYPAKYASSGVMSFVVSQDGVVYEKDLGTDTATQAPGLTEYKPDESWTAVRVP